MVLKRVGTIRQPLISRTFIGYLTGIIIGLCLAYFLFSTNTSKSQHSEDDLSRLSQKAEFEASHTHRELRKSVRVLCWIMVGSNHTKASYIKKTWGPRCNKLLFITTKDDFDLPSVRLPLQEGTNKNWGKTKAAFKYAYENYLDDFDWFMKTNDDTYVIVENLRYLLSFYNGSQPIYFGHKFKPYFTDEFISGDAGYVLSREALRRFIVNGIGSGDKKICRKDNGGAEDVEIGKCLKNVGVIPGNSRDMHGRERFISTSHAQHLIPGFRRNLWRQLFYHHTLGGVNRLSITAVSFYSASPTQMYVLEYLLYHLKPHGVTPKWDSNPYPTPSDRKATLEDGATTNSSGNF